MSKKMISIIVSALVASALLATYVGIAPSNAAPDEKQSQLLGVRLKASDSDLEKLARAANKAGWTEVRHDKPGTILLLTPKQYRVEQFGALLEAIEATQIQQMGLQLIGPDGRAVDPDGNPIEEK